MDGWTRNKPQACPSVAPAAQEGGQAKKAGKEEGEQGGQGLKMWSWWLLLAVSAAASNLAGHSSPSVD